tara:strand:- start:2007 stop:2570 length:564 start_codon:yes stop_codon:yes gene_type:complete
MSSLSELHAQFNKLTHFPEELQLLERLQSLNVSHNKITHLPSYLTTLKCLDSIFVSHNPIKGDVPREVCDRGGKQLLNYLRKQLHNNRGTKDAYRLKVMLCGEENVGKTTLATLLSAKSVSSCIGNPDVFAHNTATDGIEVRKCMKRIPLAHHNLIPKVLSDVVSVPRNSYRCQISILIAFTLLADS